ncbi:hypothetical protein TWF225_001517 [Orbilia oligospora]|nr:hypothetical protein TWF225_001517 [Orbilia oligospora]KAF3267848.1 hypothetical protein TWF217_011578 [Orbilia oligospora]KAF3269571.1 hypothetical protein TWF128_005775 [Orbilia oligospora]KAF3296534.1 hypothetical protein TWF132_010128 [Orbilia oligospora]
MGRAKFAAVEVLTELESTILQDDILVSSQVNKAKEKCWQPLVNFDILEAGPGLAKQEKVMIARKKKQRPLRFTSRDPTTQLLNWLTACRVLPPHRTHQNIDTIIGQNHDEIVTKVYRQWCEGLICPRDGTEPVLVASAYQSAGLPLLVSAAWDGTPMQHLHTNILTRPLGI